MSNLAEFFAMGGHGPYVWTAYGLTGSVLILLFLTPILGRRRLVQAEARRRRREET